MTSAVQFVVTDSQSPVVFARHKLTKMSRNIEYTITQHYSYLLHEFPLH